LVKGKPKKKGGKPGRGRRKEGVKKKLSLPTSWDEKIRGPVAREKWLTMYLEKQQRIRKL